MDIRSTREVGALLGLPVAALNRAIYEGRLDPPAKGPGGSFCWLDKDIQQASWVLRRRDASDVLGGV